MNKQDLPPHKVVVDLVLWYLNQMPKNTGYAFRSDSGTLVISAVNHLGQPVCLSLQTHLDGEPFDGDEKTPPRFVLYKIAPSVWKVSPSVLNPMLHAYVTIVDVPEPAPWEVA